MHRIYPGGRLARQEAASGMCCAPDAPIPCRKITSDDLLGIKILSLNAQRALDPVMGERPRHPNGRELATIMSRSSAIDLGGRL